MSNVSIRKNLSTTFDQALIDVPAALKTEGFGVLTEIDIQKTLKEKLGASMRRYRILGACNPPLAHAALQADLDVGVMLPCNVVIYESDDGRAVVTTIDPTKTIAALGNPAMEELASAVKDKLSRVLEKLE